MMQKSNSVLMAEEDGVEFYEIPNRKANKAGYVFKVPCERCERKVETKVYIREKHYVCEYCKRMLNNRKKAVMQNFYDSVLSEGEQRVSKACEEMRKQIKDFDTDYKKCIDAIMKRSEKFDSIPEVMVAIELLHLGHKIIIQQKVNTYFIDLMIPEDKLALEIDGKIYHGNKNEIRDEVIQRSLGREWQILHIPAEQIRRNIKMLNTVIEKGKALR